MKIPVIIVFSLMVIAQIFVPANMVFQQEQILEVGKIFRFKIVPYDPNDPFRGKYVTLAFEADRYTIQETAQGWTYGETVYAELETATDNFVKVTGITKQKPDNAIAFVKAKVRSTQTNNEKTTIMLQYPFHKFYMEESKAFLAEEKVREMRRDTNNLIWAHVKVLKGASALEAVYVNGIPIKDLVTVKE